MTTRIAEIKRRWEVPIGTMFDLEQANEDMAYLLQRCERLEKALTDYANPKNWGNGGFHGERDTVWMGGGLRGSDGAKQALKDEVTK